MACHIQGNMTKKKAFVINLDVVEFGFTLANYVWLEVKSRKECSLRHILSNS